MNDQLVLLESDDDRQWQIDERTREIGRKGLALAREALREAAVRAAA